MKTVSILGVTGSIGRSACDVLVAHPSLFSVESVTAHKNVEALAACARRLKARRAVIADDSLFGQIKDNLSGSGIEAQAGAQAVVEAASDSADICLAAIVGIAGLMPVMAALGRGKRVLIANKEPLVAAGPLVMAAAAESGAQIVPIDSEHNAVFQLFEPENRRALQKVTLTASGGPFRTASPAEMAKATREQALRHPNWSMGAKITIDSATLMNKGLEMIEARTLFQLAPEQIDTIIHPQSIVHALVSYADGSVLAHLGAPDMRTAITHAFGYPERLGTPGRMLDLQTLSALTFEPVDTGRFPAIALARACLSAPLASCIALNAANELAVLAFLENRIAFGDIIRVVSNTLEKVSPINILNCEAVLAHDQAVRRAAQSYIMSRAA